MEKIEITKDMIRKMVDGTIGDQDVIRMQNSYKDEDRFHKYLEVLQERVRWKDKILMRISDNVYIVEKDKQGGEIICKCFCGHEFFDYRINWKMGCRINVRRTLKEMQEVYQPDHACPEPEWQEIREFYCPDCGTQLAVEVLAPGFPVVFEMLADVPGFYREYLGTPLTQEKKFASEDKTLELTKTWGKEI